VEEEGAEDVDHGQARAVRARDDPEAAPGCERGRVRRSQDAVGRVEVGGDLGPAERVVAEGDRVDSGREQAVGQAGRDPDPVRDVLPVRDADVDPEVCAQRRQALLERLPAGGSDDIGDEQNAQGAKTLETVMETLRRRPRSGTFRDFLAQGYGPRVADG
jgi:hypothetical protein